MLERCVESVDWHMLAHSNFLRFNQMLATDELRAWYGPQHVKLAVDMQVIESLMISDKLFRSDNLEERRSYVQMVERVKAENGEVLIFSSQHESGHRE